MTFEDDTTCCKMHKLGVFPFFVTIGDILQHKLYSVITIGVMLEGTFSSLPYFKGGQPQVTIDFL